MQNTVGGQQWSWMMNLAFWYNVTLAKIYYLVSLLNSKCITGKLNASSNLIHNISELSADMKALLPSGCPLTTFYYKAAFQLWNLHLVFVGNCQNNQKGWLSNPEGHSWSNFKVNRSIKCCPHSKMIFSRPIRYPNINKKRSDSCAHPNSRSILHAA